MRIAIVNDVQMAREVLKILVEEIGSHEIAWMAKDGAEAVRICAKNTPDLILMDLVMPVMDGVEATREIMRNSPCAILIVTADVHANVSMVFDAMGAGALDVVNTPSMDYLKGRDRGGDLKRKIDIAEKYLGKSIEKKLKPPVFNRSSSQGEVPPLVVVGASTGGPSALAKMLLGFPSDTRYAIVVVQHVDESLTGGLAEWLGHQTLLKVRLAEEGATPLPGFVLLAGRDMHLVMTEELSLQYQDQPTNTSCRPSVDLFFHSVACNWPKESVAVLLTGMGSDGAKGMQALYQKGWYTIVQNQDSCVVFGMPKSAIELGVVKAVLPIDDISSRILSL